MGFNNNLSIGNMEIKNTLIHLGRNVNIMPFLVVDRIRYMWIEPPTCTLKMEDKTCGTLVGKVNSVLIQCDKHSFPIDYVILDIKADPKIHFILVRPFMKTGRMLVYMNKW